MERKTDVRRDTRPFYKLYDSLEQKAALEARNGLLQFDEVLRLVDETIQNTFRLRPSTIQSLHRIAIQDIYVCAGNYRTAPVEIQGTAHQPPPWQEVPKLVEDFCDYVNDNWASSTPIHLAAYAMWKVNWIHPFAGGNGRTSRAVSYLCLCSKLGYRLPGTLTIPEQIVSNRQPYYEALDQADAAWAERRINVSRMEDLLGNMLARQLVEIHKKATGE